MRCNLRNRKMHCLIKYFANKKYLKEFLAGQLYMNTLDYFWNNGFEEQKDIFEGVVCTVPVKDFAAFPTDFQSAQACDYRFRAEGYRYCNVLCFYKIDFSIDGPFVHYEYDTNMEKFGQFVAFITNEREFLRRIEAAASREKYQVLCGDVRYHNLMLNGKPGHLGNQMHLKVKDRFFTIEELQRRGFSINKRDCFDKGAQYQAQNEWRVALYRGEKSVDAYKLNIGSISDIVTWFPIDKFKTGIDENVNRYGLSDFMGWYGNTNRKKMREAFYELGDCKTSLFATIG